jgi:hypothetical protein
MEARNLMLDISNFPWAECAITENRVQYVADTLALRRNKRGTGIHRFEFELVTVEMEMEVGRRIKAKLSGAINEVMVFTHPRLSFIQGTEPASKIQTLGSNVAGSKSLSLTSPEPWQLLAGDYIQVSNDTKIYEVKDDTLLQAGNQTVSLTFPLRYPVTSGTDIVANGTAWHLESSGSIDSSGMAASDNQDMELTLIAVEKL